MDRYIEQFSSPADALSVELERETNLRVVQPKMLSGAAQGAFLRLLTAVVKPRRVLEIGTFTGYSALSIAAALDDGARLHTVEVDDELEDLARGFFARSPHGSKIEMHIGSALEVVPRLAGVFDLVFIDGDKRQYPDYLRMLMGDSEGGRAGETGGGSGVAGSRASGEGGRTSGKAGGKGGGFVRPGSVLLADNVLWYGKVADKSATDPHTEAIRRFNAMVAADPRLENVIVPLRDGLNLIRVRG